MTGSGLHRDQGGALAPLFLFVLLFFLWAALGILNTGQDASDRINAQNAIDAVSLMASEQAARDLNVMAMNQVASTQSFTVALSSMALQQALNQTKFRTLMATIESYTQCAGRSSIYTVWYCLMYMGFMIDYAIDTWSIDGRYQPDRGVEIGNRLTTALTRMNRHLVATHPQRVGELTATLADANGLEAVFVYPACDPGNGSQCNTSSNFPGPSLPVEPASLSDGFRGVAALREMCLGIEQGSDGYARLDFSRHGFPIGRGPLTAGGSSANPTLRAHMNQASGLSQLLPSFYNTMRSAYAINYTQLSKHSSQQTPRSNEFLDAFDIAWSMGCPDLSSIGSAASAASRSPMVAALVGAAQFNVERPGNYWLKGRPPTTALAGSFGLAGVIANAYASDFDDFSLLYLGAQTKGERSNAQAFGFDDEPFYAYAQGITFNKSSHELYTGMWGAELVPAFHMDDPATVGAALGQYSAPPSFEKLRRVMAAASNGGGWQDVNTH